MIEEVVTGFQVNATEIAAIKSTGSVQLDRNLSPITKVGERVGLECWESGVFKERIVGVITNMDQPPAADRRSRITIQKEESK